MAWSRALTKAGAGAALALLVACAATGLDGEAGGGGASLTLPLVFERDAADDARLRDALEERERLRGSEPGAHPGPGTRALQAELRALADADEAWVAPRRVLDDLDREGLTGPAAWARRAAAWQTTGSGRDAYLLGRLETPARARELFTDATDRAPGLAWGWHGLAVTESNAGAPWEAADALADRAADRVSSVADAVLVTRVRIRLLAAAGQHARAEQLADMLGLYPLLDPAERASFRALSLTMALQQGGMSIDLSGGGFSISDGDGGDQRSALLRAALALLGPDSDLSDPDAASLARVVLRAPYTGRSRTDLLRLVAPALRARLDAGDEPYEPLADLVDDLEGKLDARLLGPAPLPGPRPTLALSAEDRLAVERFRRGDLAGWLGAWSAQLPARVRGSVLGDLALEEGVVDPLPVAHRLASLGWLEAAEVLLASRRALDRFHELLPPAPAAASGLELELVEQTDGQWAEVARTVTARAALLDELEQLFDRRYEDGDLAGLLADLEELVAGTAATGHGLSSAAIADSPLDTYGPFARLVTPLTPDDEPTPGLQTLLRELGRVAIVGEQFGTLDGTVRPLLAVEPIAGEHLGAPYSGTILWCAGVDVPSRAERAGAGLAGAAVHDGYWVDLEVVRAGYEAWRQRAEDLRPASGWASVDGARVPGAPALLGGHAPTRRVPLLGQADRLALVLLAERRGEPPSIDELLELVTVHEEGHLCDRARFLPLGEKWGAGLRFFAGCGLSPTAMLRRLEYRAQLVAMAVVPDPRLVLWEVLEQAEATEATANSGVTPHGAAYVELLNDLVELIDERGLAGGGLDPDRYLRWQLHLLAPEVLRELAVELARREGLTGSG